VESEGGLMGAIDQALSDLKRIFGDPELIAIQRMGENQVNIYTSDGVATIAIPSLADFGIELNTIDVIYFTPCGILMIWRLLKFQGREYNHPDGRITPNSRFLSQQSATLI
jgi:hypothetical protein